MQLDQQRVVDRLEALPASPSGEPAIVLDDRRYHLRRPLGGNHSRSMPNNTDPQGDDESLHPGKKQRNIPNTLPLPPRVASSRSPHSAHAHDLSVPPVLFPPPPIATEPQVDWLSWQPSLTASLPSRSRTSTQNTSVSRDISWSPVKKVTDLSGARPKIIFNGCLEDVPKEVDALLERFQNVFQKKHLTPSGLKGDITALEHNVFYQTSGIHVFTTAAVTAQDRETLKELTRIRDNARSCHRPAKPAPSWHEEVFRPLLDHAVRLENMFAEAQVQVENITTVPVSPQFLPVGVDDMPSQAKRVDYAIYLSQDQDQVETIRSRLEARNMAARLRYALKTKTDEPGGVSARAQLAIWMAGLRNRLESLMRPGRQGDEMDPYVSAAASVAPIYLKPTPCVMVQGYEWKMYWCCVSKRGKTILHGPTELGTTQNILGTYCILAGLRELIKYGRDEYAVWFMENCLW
ncbi:hypothetical protein QBC46DRAFT_356927 [Diplogelasinospora grovesii]|uniref:PD-(D/E)XK nuclease-like domain-containing protein n=1 Tax=Diplogelasinospora grovesii TaxID=303347 RepID=A0AAN6N488_9PEZI|nr:hypothetical protein QBC46DRAFT_356927 [Diplogelasinospora grovesii]